MLCLVFSRKKLHSGVTSGLFFFFKQKTAYEIMPSLVGSEMCIRDSISLIQEVRAKRVMDRIAILMRPKASVVREGRVQDLDPAQVVLGDVLYLHPGDQVVVDGSMVGEGRMEVDESLLTGESDLVTKHPGDALLSGSFCMTGGGYYEAQKVGLESFANKLTAKATEFKRELTPLQRQINQIVRVLLLVVVVFEILVWAVSYTHLRAHETRHDLVCRLLLEKKK